MTERDPLAAIFEKTWRDCRADGMSITATADMLAAVFREELLDAIGEEEAEGLSKADHVMVQSVVGGSSGAPIVQCRVGYEQWQWDVEEAREHAGTVLACAEAAVHDAAMVRWLTLGPIGLDQDAALDAVGDLRRFRGDLEREDWRVPND
jgi:hypothetical protein